MIQVKEELSPFEVWSFTLVTGDQFIYQVQKPLEYKQRQHQTSVQFVAHGLVRTYIKGPIWQDQLVVPFEYTALFQPETSIEEYRPNQNWAGAIDVVQVAEEESLYICVSPVDKSKSITMSFVQDGATILENSLIIPMVDCIIGDDSVVAYKPTVITQKTDVLASVSGKIAVFNIV